MRATIQGCRCSISNFCQHQLLLFITQRVPINRSFEYKVSYSANAATCVAFLKPGVSSVTPCVIHELLLPTFASIERLLAES
jgi:hypothetical protein